MPQAIHFKSFKVSENIEEAHVFYKKHHDILKNYSLQALPSANDWLKSDNAYCLAAYTSKGEMIGGMRLQLRELTTKLPIQISLRNHSTMLDQFVEKKAENGKVAEICGLWIDSSHRKRGLSLPIMKATINLAHQQNVKWLFGFYSNFTKNMVESLGFELISSLENKGIFIYPTKEYLSYVGIQNLYEKTIFEIT